MTVALFVAIFTFLTALLGFGSAVVVSIRTGRKVDEVHGKVQEVKILVNGNLQRVQDQLADALARLEAVKEQELTRKLTGKLPDVPAMTITSVVPVGEGEKS